MKKKVYFDKKNANLFRKYRKKDFLINFKRKSESQIYIKKKLIYFRKNLL